MDTPDVIDRMLFPGDRMVGAEHDLARADLRHQMPQALDAQKRLDEWHMPHDPLTHVGIVEEVLPDRTVLVLHATNHGIVREPMNLRRRHVLVDASGQVINAALRRKSAYDGPRTPHLMSELFSGFGTVVGVDRAAARTVARRSSPALPRR